MTRERAESMEESYGETSAVAEVVAEESLREAVRRRYASAARGAGGCCGSPGDCGGGDPISADLYGRAEVAGLPEAAVRASLGCGNPTALAELHPGEVVLDLGSGAGLDVLLSARRVGPTGKAYGLDMTDEMLELARKHQREAGVENVEFLKGYLEEIPLPDESVDVILSNCVINLSADKGRVLSEAFRVLRPGGRFAVSDIVIQGRLPRVVLRGLELWSGCLAGALREDEYRAMLRAAGFRDVDLEVTRVHGPELLRGLPALWPRVLGTALRLLGPLVPGRFTSSFVRARKPVG